MREKLAEFKSQVDPCCGLGIVDLGSEASDWEHGILDNEADWTLEQKSELVTYINKAYDDKSWDEYEKFLVALYHFLDNRYFDFTALADFESDYQGSWDSIEERGYELLSDEAGYFSKDDIPIDAFKSDYLEAVVYQRARVYIPKNSKTAHCFNL